MLTTLTRWMSSGSDVQTNPDAINQDNNSSYFRKWMSLFPTRTPSGTREQTSPDASNQNEVDKGPFVWIEDEQTSPDTIDQEDEGLYYIMFRKLTSGLYIFSEGTSAAVTAAQNVVGSFSNKNDIIYKAVPAALVAGLARAISTAYFEKPTIDKSTAELKKDRLAEAVDSAIHPINTKPLEIISLYQYDEQQPRIVEPDKLNSMRIQSEKEIENNSCNHILSTGSQAIYLLGFSTLLSLSNRYFLINKVILNLFDITLPRPAFWALVLIPFGINAIFSYLTEDYPTCEGISQAFGENKPPFYASFFKCVSGKIPRKFINLLGSLEHTINDDLLPWLGYIPKEVRDYLLKNPSVAATVSAIAAILSIPFAILILMVTYFFEGKSAEKNLARIRGELQENDNPHINKDLLKAIQSFIWIIAPVHGAASAMPIFQLFQELFKDEHVTDYYRLNILAALALSFGFFLATSAGNALSEVRVSLIEIEAMSKDQEKDQENERSLLLTV